jgi:hypothetical protein
MYNRLAVFAIALSWVLLAGCAVDVNDTDSASSDVVSIDIHNGSTTTITGYIIYQNVYEPLEDVHDRPIPSGMVSLYSWFGTYAGQGDVDYYREHGTVRRRTCEEIKDLRHPFRDGRLRYGSYMCMLELTKSAATHGSGYVLIELEQIDETDDSLTGEVSYPYLSVEDGRAVVTSKLPIQDRPHPSGDVLVWVPEGKSFAVEPVDFVVMRATDDNGQKAELRFQFVNY